jgi:hypothetical protein
MKKILLLTFLVLSVLLQAQHKTPTPDEIRISIAKSITELHVAPEPVEHVTGHLAGRWCAGDESAKPAMDFVVAELQRVLTSRK